MTDTTRDLIQRLADIADALDGRKPLVFAQGQVMDGFTALANFQALANEARAYLAQPEPEEPTDEELHNLWLELYGFHDGPTSGDVAGIARAVLARWGK
jgi:hypothetical protein